MLDAVLINCKRDASAISIVFPLVGLHGSWDSSNIDNAKFAMLLVHKLSFLCPTISFLLYPR